MAESFFSHMKTEMFYQQHFDNHLAERTAVMGYIESWFNRRRPDSHNGGLQPAAALTAYQDRCQLVAAEEKNPSNCPKNLTSALRQRLPEYGSLSFGESVTWLWRCGGRCRCGGRARRSRTGLFRISARSSGVEPAREVARRIAALSRTIQPARPLVMLVMHSLEEGFISPERELISRRVAQGLCAARRGAVRAAGRQSNHRGNAAGNKKHLPIALSVPDWFDYELWSHSAAEVADPSPTRIPEQP